MTDRSRVAWLLAIPVLAGCQVSVSAGGPDYEKLESGIADELNAQYARIAQVSSVDCPRQPTAPKSGETFNCIAEVDGHDVRVEATAEDDNGNFSFRTLDVIFDLGSTAHGLAEQISANRGFGVTVECGDGLKVVAIGDSFECTAADGDGNTRTVRLTAGGVDENDRWELLE